MPPQIDMTPDGQFVHRPPPLLSRVALGALVVAALAGLLAGAALALWIAMALIPIAVLAGVVAWVAFRIQRWRGGRAGSGPRDLYRP
ncbi:MAG TPA: hypothetical protein VME92_21175 [Acetobacteraceae bacterium]|nr:hypothetical protein [Acetobacteraceae bacterium]